MNDTIIFNQRDLVLKVNPVYDPNVLNLAEWSRFLDVLCGDREYQKEAKPVLEKLIQEDYIPLAIEQVDQSNSLRDFEVEKNKKYVIIVGNEVEGVQQELIDICEKAIEIPQSGTKHSLNVSICVGIVLWEFYRSYL